MLNNFELFVWCFCANKMILKIDFLNFIAKNSCFRSISRNIQTLKNWNCWLWRLSNWWFVIWSNSFDFIQNFRKTFLKRRWNQIMKCNDRHCNKKWMLDFSAWSMQLWNMHFLTIRFVCIYYETRWIWIVNCFSFFRIFFRFYTTCLIEWVRRCKIQSIFEMTDLLIIESKTIDSMMFDSMIVDSMSIDSLTIELIESLTEKSIESLIESSIETLIESFVAFEKFAVD